MGADRLDAVIRSLTGTSSRRGIARAVAGFTLPAVLGSLFNVEGGKAKRKRKKKKTCSPCRIAKKGKCKGPKPDGAACPDGRCLAGACTPPPSSPPPPPPPETRADAACDVPGSFLFGTSGGERRIAQTFTALASGNLVSVQLIIAKNPGSVGDFVLYLGAVDGEGVPTNTPTTTVPLALTSLANAAVPDGESQLNFAFPAPPSIVAGSRYALIVNRPASDNLAVRAYEDNVCGLNGFWTGNLTEEFRHIPVFADVFFRTFVSS